MQKTFAPIFVLLLTLIAACGEHDKNHLVAGNEYTIPRSQTVSDVPWVPNSDLYPDSAGFAFAGCDLHSVRDQSECPFKFPVGGGTFDNAGTYASWMVEDWPWK